MTNSDPVTAATESLHNLMSAVFAVADAVQGYRNRLESEAGFSPTAAEVMAMELHKELLTIVFGHKKKEE